MIGFALGGAICLVALAELVWMFAGRHRTVHPTTATLSDLLEPSDCQTSLVGSRLTTDTEVLHGQSAASHTP